MKKLNFIYLLGVFLLIAWIAASCSDKDDTGPGTSLEQQLQSTLRKAIANWGGKGASVAVILPDGEVIRSTGGISHADQPIHPDMVFSAGSISKMFTAALILKYQEEGKLNLEDSIEKWLPSFNNIDGSITIRQCLNHTSGIFDLIENQTLLNSIFTEPNRIWPIEDVLSNYVLEPYFEKGTQWRYTNTGYVVLRMIIEQISGSTVAAEYRKHLIDPAGLKNTYCAIEEQLPDLSAHGWIDVNGDGYYNAIPADYFKSFYSIAVGGIFCTAEDLALWIRELLYYRSILQEESLISMRDYYRPTPGEELVDGYGLGLFQFNKDRVSGLEACGHGGNPLGYAAAVLYLEDYDVCISIMDNTEDGITMPVIEKVIDLVVGHLDNKEA